MGKPLDTHPVSWVYPGSGPSTLGSIDLISVKRLMLRTIAGHQPWEELGSRAEDEGSGDEGSVEYDEEADGDLFTSLPETITTDQCTGSVLDLAKGVLRADKGCAMMHLRLCPCCISSHIPLSDIAPPASAATAITSPRMCVRAHDNVCSQSSP